MRVMYVTVPHHGCVGRSLEEKRLLKWDQAHLENGVVFKKMTKQITLRLHPRSPVDGSLSSVVRAEPND